MTQKSQADVKNELKMKTIKTIFGSVASQFTINLRQTKRYFVLMISLKLTSVIAGNNYSKDPRCFIISIGARYLKLQVFSNQYI